MNPPTDHQTSSRQTRLVMGLLLGLVAAAVTAILLAPVALSSRDLLDWAAAPTGLGLPDSWPVLVILSLDAAAIACVLMTVLCTWRGEKGGIFNLLIWLFAITSAFANWRHGLTPYAPPDRVWFIPLMSLTGPGVLDVVLHRARFWITHDRAITNLRDDDAARLTLSSAVSGAGWQRWIPGLGSLADTLGAHRTRLLLPDVTTFAQSVTAYRQLCPDGSVRVAAALRRRHEAEAEARLHRVLHLPATSGDNTAIRLPVDLMKRIPVDQDRYRRWQAAWTDLRQEGKPSGRLLQEVADLHQISTRQVGFIRRAGQAGLLDSPIPPAVRLAMTTTANSGADASSDAHLNGTRTRT